MSSGDDAVLDYDFFLKIINGSPKPSTNKAKSKTCVDCGILMLTDTSNGRYVCESCGLSISASMSSENDDGNAGQINRGFTRMPSTKVTENRYFNIWSRRNIEIGSPFPNSILRTVAQKYSIMMSATLSEYDDEGIMIGERKISGNSSRLNGFIMLLFKQVCAAEKVAVIDQELCHVICGDASTSSINKGVRVANIFASIGYSTDLNTDQEDSKLLKIRRYMAKSGFSADAVEKYSNFIIDVLSMCDAKCIGGKRDERTQIGGSLMLLRDILKCETISDDLISEVCGIKKHTVCDFYAEICQPENKRVYHPLFIKYKLIDDCEKAPATRTTQRIEIQPFLNPV